MPPLPRRRAARARVRAHARASARAFVLALLSRARPSASSARTSKIGALRECVDASRSQRRLCGASAAVVLGQNVYVASSRADAVTVIDASDPEAMRVAGSAASFGGMRRPTDLHLHASQSYVAVLATGDVQTKKSSVVVVDVSASRWSADGTTITPTVAASGHNCTATEKGGRTFYDGYLCGATAFAIVGNLAYVACGDTNRLTVMSLPSDVSKTALEPVAVVGTIQSEELTNAEAIMVANNKAYVRSDGVCGSCVAVVDVTSASSMSMLATKDISEISSDVPTWRWSTGYLARGAHRDNASYPYDWVVDPVSSSVTSVARECVNVALAIGDTPAACVGRNEFAYDADAETSAFNFDLLTS